MADATLTLAQRLGELYRPSATGPVNISAASRALGVSRDTVRRMLAGGSSPRGEAALARAERVEDHRPKWIQGSHEGAVVNKLFPDGMPRIPGERDVPGQIKLLASRKADGSINFTRTAKALGVSARTLARWVRGEARPKAMHQEVIHSEVRATTLAKSDAAMAAATEVGLSTKITAMVKISESLKSRTIPRSYGPEQVAAAQMAWLNGGNQGLQEWFANDLEQNYFRSAGILAHVPIDINELH